MGFLRIFGLSSFSSQNLKQALMNPALASNSALEGVRFCVKTEPWQVIGKGGEGPRNSFVQTGAMKFKGLHTRLPNDVCLEPKH